MIKINILTIDLEDWYMDTHISTWDLYEDRIVQTTRKILEMLDGANTQATFFVVGYIAEHYPGLIRSIKGKGHEIALHGYSHTAINSQTPTEFEKDLLRSLRILEKITGDKVAGYRACEFSVNKRTAWAIDVLKKYGLRYDSSVFPVKTYLYGVPSAPLFPYYISATDIEKEASPKEGFLEIPLSTYRIPIVNKNIPMAGGFFFRLYPYWFIKYAIKEINKKNQIAVIYVHPWEFDPEQPKLKELKFGHYFNLSNTEKKFRMLLKDFDFIPIRRWLNYHRSQEME